MGAFAGRAPGSMHRHGVHFGPSAATSLARFCTGADSIEARVIKAVKKYAEARKEELMNDTETGSSDKEKMLEMLDKQVASGTVWDDLGFDDLDKVEVLLEVEDEFGHVIPDDDADKTHSVSDAVAYLKQHL